MKRVDETEDANIYMLIVKPRNKMECNDDYDDDNILFIIYGGLSTSNQIFNFCFIVLK